MLIWKLCKTFRLKEAYCRLPMLLQKNKILTTIFRKGHGITHGSEIGRMTSLSRKAKRFRVQDKMPKSCELIYNSAITKLVILAYHTSHGLFILILSGFYVYTQQELEYPIFEPILKSEKTSGITIYSDVESYLIYATMLLYNGVGFLFCRRTVLRIWYNPENQLYTLILPKMFTPQGRQLVVKPGGMTIKYKRSQLPLVSSMHTMNGWTYYMNSANFEIPREYHKLISHL